MPVIQTLAGRCRINFLVISSGGDLVEAHGATMLAGLALAAGLEQLHLSPTEISLDLMQAIADLPRLRFLSMATSRASYRSIQGGDACELLASGACSRTLQHVRWSDAHSGRRSFGFSLVQLPALTSLTLLEPNLYQQAFRSLFTSPNLLGLQSITLVEFKLRGNLKAQRYNRQHFCIGPPEQDFVEVFTALTQLTRLTLVECEGLGALLHTLIHSPSLRELAIQPECDPRCKRWNSTFPTMRVIGRLLQSSRRLFVTLHIPSVQWLGLHTKNVLKQRERFAVVADALAPRYRLSTMAVDGLDEPFVAQRLYL